MSNLLRSTTALAMHIASSYIFPGSILVDATCGNGNDSLFLASFHPKKLYCFDIQNSAILSTKENFLNSGYKTQLEDKTIELINDTHENITNYISDEINLIMFNLGYLPGSNKSLSTTVKSTLPTLQSVLKLLSKNGLICITMYSGHAEGLEEKKAVLNFAKSLDKSIYHTAYVSFTNQPANPPEILFITRKK